MAHLLVIGSPSIDTLHLKDQSVISAGGAGMYTAMAAQRSGVQVSMLAPRPDPMPEPLQPIAERLRSWLGPIVLPTEMPHFEISHEGDKAIYLDFFIGAEAKLDPDMLPADMSLYDGVHIISPGDAHKQQVFLQVCRARGTKFISAGAFIKDIKEKSNVVEATLEQADVFFVNEEEAISMYGSVEKAKAHPGKLLYITLGEKGAIVIQGDYQTQLPATPANILDPTGAGDTFCGATLAHLLQGVHPIMAANMAMSLAAQMIEHIGPTALLWNEPPPSVALDERVTINEPQIRKVSKVIKNLPEAMPFNFVGDDFPPVGHPLTLDYFFSSTLQQFSFWEAVDGKYDHPLIAPIDGDKLKGSSYLYRAFLRPLNTDPEFYTPKRQANLTKEDMLALFRADDGSDPMPALDLHLWQAQQYGRDMLALGITPQDVIKQSQNSAMPLKTFLMMLDHIGGYKEDPLRKKSSLLVLCLNQRPEIFLSFEKEESVPPVIDYHAMRSCLRTGLIDVVDQTLREKLANRQVLSPDSEWAVRYAAYRAIEDVVAVSGKSLGAVDWFTFNYTRSHCPEMSEPVCQECAVDPVCAHRKELFQPVIRTTFY